MNLLSLFSADTTMESGALSSTRQFTLSSWARNILIALLIFLIEEFIRRVIIPKIFPRHFEGIVKKINKITPDDFDVRKPRDLDISEEEYIQSFILRPADQKIKEMIEKRRNVLILGPSMQGKSREAFQILYEMKEKLGGFSFLRPLIKQYIKDIPKKKKVIIFLNDLDKYANENFALSEFLRNFQNETIIVATCRTGDEYDNACKKYSYEIETFEKINLEYIDERSAEELARKTGRPVDDFDGTPGSILLGLGRIEQKIHELPKESKALLRAMKLLAISYIYSPKVKVLKGVSEDIFLTPGIQFEDNLRLLIETGLIMEYKNILRIWHDKYFDFIDYHFDIEHLHKLSQTLFRLKEIEGLIYLSSWYGNNRLYNEVIETCNIALELGPKYTGAFNNRGLAYYYKGELDKAIENCDMAIKFGPKYAGTFNNRGLAYTDKGELDKAIEDYNEAIRLDPKDAVAFNNRGNVYIKRGELDKAIKDCNKAIKLNPKYAGAFNNRGLAYYYKGKLNKAIDDYNEGKIGTVLFV